MFKDKRGIAPLVATLLLLSFAVSLGVVIMNFGRAQVELQAQCPININLKLAEIGGSPQICHDGSTISFTIENGVNIDVSGLVISVIGSKEAKTKELSAEIIKAGTYVGNIPYSTSKSGEIRQVKISPKIILYDEEQICIEKALVAEKVGNC